MGKAAFAHLQQNWRAAADLRQERRGGERAITRFFKMVDIGDIIGVEGYLFRTRTGELSIHAEKIEFPFEDAAFDAGEVAWPWRMWRTRFRQRYLDLIANPEVAQGLFVTRAKLIGSLRRQTGGRAASSKWRRR